MRRSGSKQKQLGSEDEEIYFKPKQERSPKYCRKEDEYELFQANEDRKDDTRKKSPSTFDSEDEEIDLKPRRERSPKYDGDNDEFVEEKYSDDSESEYFKEVKIRKDSGRSNKSPNVELKVGFDASSNCESVANTDVSLSSPPRSHSSTSR